MVGGMKSLHFLIFHITDANRCSDYEVNDLTKKNSAMDTFKCHLQRAVSRFSCENRLIH